MTTKFQSTQIETLLFLKPNLRNPKVSEPKPNALMEKQQFLDFFTAVLQDESLLEKLMAFIDAKDNVAIIQLASECGYHFSEESRTYALSEN
jgi:hypothetical protein